MRLTKTTLFLLFLLLPLSLWAQKTTGAYSIDLTVKDKDTKEAIIMATVQLQPSPSYRTYSAVPAQGDYG